MLHRFRDIAFGRSKIAIFSYSLRSVPRWRGFLHHIIVSDTSLKTRSFGLHSFAESLGISSTTFTQCAPKATHFTEITQNNCRYAVQGHSRSPILAPIESSYMQLPINFLLVINTNLPPILHRFRDIVFDRSKIIIFCFPSCV